MQAKESQRSKNNAPWNRSARDVDVFVHVRNQPCAE